MGKEKAMTAVEEIEFLERVMQMLPVGWRSVCLVAVRDPRFRSAPGSSGHHHAFEGGLATHTAEVVRNVLRLANVVLRDPAQRGAAHGEG